MNEEQKEAIEDIKQRLDSLNENDSYVLLIGKNSQDKQHSFSITCGGATEIQASMMLNHLCYILLNTSHKEDALTIANNLCNQVIQRIIDGTSQDSQQCTPE